MDNMAHTRLPEATVRRLFQQLVVAIDYCHRLGIANRDIKARRCCCHSCLKVWHTHRCQSPSWGVSQTHRQLDPVAPSP